MHTVALEHGRTSARCIAEAEVCSVLFDNRNGRLLANRFSRWVSLLSIMSALQKPSSKDTHPLPLSSTLHDLALLRASDLDFASLLPQPSQSAKSDSAPTDASSSPSSDPHNAAVEASVQRSLEFSREARAALKLLNTDAVEREGGRVEDVRGRLEDVMSGLDA